LDTLATALYVRTDDLLKASPERVPRRPRVGIVPKISDAELVTLAVLQALLGFTSEARWLRYTRVHLRYLFGYLPQQPGYNKRLRRLGATIGWLVGVLARDTSLWTDDVWVAGSTPVECARSVEAVHRSDLAGWAEYGYCASHSRYFWGLRLHLVCTLHGLPVGFALTGAKADERQALLGILDADPALTAGRAGQILIADKNHYAPRVRSDPDPGRPAPATPGPQGRTPAGRDRVLQAAAAGHRIDQRHVQRPTRPRTPPRPHTRRSLGPRPPTRPGTDRRHLAQRPHRPTRQTIPDRLRPLNPLESII
jgi:hypothetical protein